MMAVSDSPSRELPDGVLLAPGPLFTSMGIVEFPVANQNWRLLLKESRWFSFLSQLVKLCSNMVDAGKAYIITNKQFVGGVRDLSQQCKKDEMISECLDKFGDSLQEMVNYHMILFDQAQRSVRQQLNNFVKEDVRKFKETKKQFDKVREDMEIALVKNAQAPRHKPHEVEEATGTLTITRKCFRHLALDYVLQINVLQAKKKFEILDATEKLRAQKISLCLTVSSRSPLKLDQLVIDSAVEKREMEHKHALIQQRVSLKPEVTQAETRRSILLSKIISPVPQRNAARHDMKTLGLLSSQTQASGRVVQAEDFSYDESKVEFNVDAPNGVVMEGYLFKRASNAFKTWNRRWFSIQNSQLVYQKKLKDVLTVVVEDLRLCTVKTSASSPFPHCRSCMLQADSEKLRQAWIQAVQASIASAYRESPDSCYIEKNSNRVIFQTAATLERKFRRDSLFCPDELDSLFSYFDTGAGPRSKCGLSSDSGLGGSTDGSTDVLVFGSVVDSVTEEVVAANLRSEKRDGKINGNWSPWLAECLVHAEALAHGANVNWVNEEDESKTPLIQAVMGVSDIHASPGQFQECSIRAKQPGLLIPKERSQPTRSGRGWAGPPQHRCPGRQCGHRDFVSVSFLHRRLRLARMNEEMREAEGPYGHPGQYTNNSPTELQYRKCIQEFISLNIDE
ncbi:Arf-GAP with coiled-coil, ANK repeat and PH domain-containing protein 3, partial [Ophiophagus hannah]